MVDSIKVTGMVISSSPVGENDKRIVILTKELGKISAFARGARRPSNHLVACSDSFVFGTFTLRAGKDSYTLVEADVREYFRELTDNLTAMYMGYYFLELASYFGVEGQDASQMLNLLYASCKIMLTDKIPLLLIKLVYELKILVINGEYPDFNGCVICGSKENITGFSINKHGVICSKCMKDVPDAITISGSTLYTLQYIAYAPIGKLYTFTVTDEVLTELKMVITRCVKAYITDYIKSADILETLLKT